MKPENHLRIFSCVVATLPFSIAYGDDALGQWQEAAEYERLGRNDKAVEVYQALLTAQPRSQRAAVSLAMSMIEAGFYDEAVTTAEHAIAMNPYSGIWAERAHYSLARACQAWGCTYEAREAIAILRKRFPDAVSTARADLLEAELDGRGVAEARAWLDHELAADMLHDEAVAAVKREEYIKALELFDEVIASYTDSRKALRSMKVRALLLGLLPDSTEEALHAWMEIREIIEDEAPQSTLHYEALLRSGFLNLRLDDPAYALEDFALLRDISEDPELAAEAAIQAAGAYFEVLQRQLFTPEGVTPEEWALVRTMCEEAAGLPSASRVHTARADLMVFESFAWQVQPDEVVPRAAQFLEEYVDPDLRKERAAAHLFTGHALQRLGRHEEAIPHFE